MMRKRNGKLWLISGAVVCMIIALSAAFAWQSYAAEIDRAGREALYNVDIKTDKPNGMVLRLCEYNGETLYDFLDMADAVFIGTVTTDGEKYEHPSGKDKSNLTKITIAVEDVIYGEIADDEIGFIQSGLPGTDDLEMKVKRGDKVLVLAYFDEEMMCYRSVMFENGIFYIREDGLYTYSNQPDLGKYDRTALEVLMEDIEYLVKRYNMKSENNYYARMKKLAYLENFIDDLW